MNFKEKVESHLIRRGDDACWGWTGNVDNKGYPRVWSREANAYVRVSRYMMDATNPKDFVCHTCHNPECCNPNHLYIGTSRDNQLDEVYRGGVGSQKITPEVAKQITELKGTATQREIGEMFGLTQSMVSRIHNGSRWDHIGERS